MLDLVLAWGSLDGAFGMLLSCVRELPLDQGAELIGRLPNSAHSRCVGIWKQDRNFIVFATFDKVADGELAVDLIPIQEMRCAARWGRAMTDMALKLVDALSAEV